MRTSEINPFDHGSDRHTLWEMLVRRDIDAFLAVDWAAVEADFAAEAFFAVDARFQGNPDQWTLGFPDLDSYRDCWLAQAREFAATEWAEDVRAALFDATDLTRIEVRGEVALLHKKFDGSLKRADGGVVPLRWITLYHCRKTGGRWRITGFTGFLPPAMHQDASHTPAKRIPQGASQHVSAGPYSPVLEVDAAKLVVICGQAAILRDGSVKGDTIEEQAEVTLDNCETQLARAGCTFADVFKVNVYLTNLEDWPRFNTVYARRMPEPRPVRTAVGTRLLPGLIVEIEMWAVQPVAGASRPESCQNTA